MPLVRRISALAFTGALLLGAACSDDDDSPTGPTAAQVVGSYRATKLTATQQSLVVDMIAAGGSLTVNFAENGVVTGHIKVPTEGIDEDFNGTWKIDNGGVEIEDVPQDTFVEDLTFDVVGNTLVADKTFNDVRVQVTLTKQ